MLRFATFLAISVLVSLTPSSAESRRLTGQKDGISFEYTAELRLNDDVVLRGVYLDERENFELTVNRTGWVDGTVGERPVTFAVGRTKRNAIVARLKAEAPIAVAQVASDR